MGKLAKIIVAITMVVMGIALAGFSIYGQYQASQLYPAINQQLGYQACVQQVQAQQAAQVQQQVTPLEDGN